MARHLHLLLVNVICDEMKRGAHKEAVDEVVVVVEVIIIDRLFCGKKGKVPPAAASLIGHAKA